MADLRDLLLPRSCLGCGDRIPPDEGAGLICSRCLTLLRPPPPPRCSRCDVPLGTGHPHDAPCLECVDWPQVLNFARAVAVLESPADSMVHALKYEGWRALSGLMGQRMSAVCPPVTPDSVVIPVPTTRRRQRTRGYNQAWVLAEVVADDLGVVLLDALERPSGSTQVRLGPMERRGNVWGSFRPIPAFRSRIRGTEVILIDDVLTTGATAVSAAMALGEAGAKSVGLVTFARALPLGTEKRRFSRG
jgi:predicted amidophosphoribosyltransferase